MGCPNALAESLTSAENYILFEDQMLSIIQLTDKLFFKQKIIYLLKAVRDFP